MDLVKMAKDVFGESREAGDEYEYEPLKGRQSDPAIVGHSDGVAGKRNSDGYHELGHAAPARATPLTPQQQARATRILGPENMALASLYFCSALCSSFVNPPLMDYIINDMEATADEISAIDTCRTSPYLLRILFGVVSDVLPFRWQHRKPYLILGVVVFSFSNFVVSWSIAHPAGKETISTDDLCTLLFVANAADTLALLMGDALLVERSRRSEPLEGRGWMQLKAMLCYYTGLLAGELGSISVSEEEELWSWDLSVTQVYVVAGLLPMLLVVPALPALADTKKRGGIPDLVHDHAYGREHRAMSRQQRLVLEARRLWAHLWQFAQTSSVYEPAIVLYVVTVTQVENPAWSSYLENSLNFGDSDLGVLEILGNLASWMCLWLYQGRLFNVNWRRFFVVSTVGSTLMNMLLLSSLSGDTELLFYQDGYVASIITAWTHATHALQFCVAYRMFINMCDGYEATCMAVLSSILLIGTSTSRDIGTQLEQVWDVSSTTLDVHNYSGLQKLTVLCAVLPLLAMPFIVLMPISSRDQLERSQKSRVAGFMFVVFYSIISLLALVGVNVTDETSR